MRAERRQRVDGNDDAVLRVVLIEKRHAALGIPRRLLRFDEGHRRFAPNVLLDSRRSLLRPREPTANDFDQRTLRRWVRWSLVSGSPSSDDDHRTALHPGPLLLRLPDDRLRLCLHDNRRCGCWRWGLGRSSRTALHPGPLLLRCHDERLRLWLRKNSAPRVRLGPGPHSEWRRAAPNGAASTATAVRAGRSLGQRWRDRGRHWRNARHRHAQNVVA